MNQLLFNSRFSWYDLIGIAFASSLAHQSLWWCLLTLPWVFIGHLIEDWSKANDCDK